MNTTFKTIIARFHLLWVVFYVLLFGGTAAYAQHFYRAYDDDQLPSGYIDLHINKTEYEMGETVAFSVSNHFPTTIYVTNHCPEEPLNVYRWVNDTWIQLHEFAESESGECFTQERNVAIPPEGSRAYNFSDWPKLFSEPGIYRMALVVDHYNTIPFQDFVVLPPAKVLEEKQAPVPVQIPKPVIITPVIPPTVVPVVSIPEDIEVPIVLPPPRELEREYEEEEEDDD